MPYITENEYARVLRDREFLARFKRGRETDAAMAQIARAFRAKQRYIAAKQAGHLPHAARAGHVFLTAFKRATGTDWRKG